MDLRAQLARLTARRASEALPRPSEPPAGTDAATPPPSAPRGDRLGAPQTAGPQPVAPALAERLRTLGGARPTPSAPRDRDEALARLAGGRRVAPSLVLVERRHALPLVHGEVRIDIAAEAEIEVPIRKRHGIRANAARFALLDTETTGLAGGTGTLAFLVGIAWFAADALVVQQWLATSFAGEPSLLAAVRDALARSACLVTYNGKCFDIPLLKTRFALAREPHPFDALMHADLLHATRRRLHRGWPDCRLRTAEAQALAFAREDDLPGAEVPLAWRRWLRDGDARSLPRVLEHNRLDLLSLAALLELHRRPTREEAPLLHALEAHRPTSAVC